MASSGEPEQATSHAPASKRRRIAVACDTCRTRKSRCDGSRPRCSPCAGLGFECIYSPPTTATNVIVQKDYLHALENRVKGLEESFLNVRDELKGLSARVDQSGISAQPGLGERRSDDGRREDVSVSIPDFIGTEDSVDGMGAMAFADEEDQGFFGPSSNIAFLKHLSRAVVQQGCHLSPGTAEGGFVSAARPPTPLRRTAQDKRSQVKLFVLPSQSETLTLIHRYFTNTGLLFPYIYPPLFLDTYHQMAKENFAKVRKTWLGLLNMVLAMATITTVPGSSTAEKRISESDVFYQRGLGLCGNEILRGTSLEVVQFLVLMGQYLQGTQKSVQAWTIHGLAVRAALQLGLHSRNASRNFNPIEQETRKRTWHICVMLDRTLSMTFGRPAALPDNYVKMELPSKHQLERSPALVDEDTSNLSVAFFSCTLTLYKELWNILDLLYDQNIGCDFTLSVSETIAHIFSMEQKLFAWERSLPQQLQLITHADLTSLHQDGMSDPAYYAMKFRVILTLRYLNVRVLLHRPVLVKFIAASKSSHGDSQDVKLLQQIGMNSLGLCTSSAREIIDIVHFLVSGPRYGWKVNLLGAWWFSLYYTFNAALVIIGAVWISKDAFLNNPTMTSDTKISERYPSRAVSALSKLDDGNRLIDRCRYFLEQFSKVLVDPETDSSVPPTTVPNMPMPHNRVPFPSADFGLEPFGMELGEFMMDDDLIAMIDRQGLLGDSGPAYPV